MKHLANKEIFNILNFHKVENFTINKDRSVDVDGNVNISHTNITEIPVQFGRVTGYFYCSNNRLTTLLGSPKEVGGNFNCGSNQLTSLVGGPKYVGENFFCDYNQLTNLEGGPKYVGGIFFCDNNLLTTLVGAPTEIDGDFVYHNNQLPQEIRMIDRIKDIKYILQYQELYSIWRQDGSLDKFRFGEMMTDKDI